MIRKSFVASLLFTVVLGSFGCGGKPVPPVFSLYDYKRVAIVPFLNETRDKALTQDAENQMVVLLARLRAIPVIESIQVAGYLKSIGATAESASSDANVRRKIADHFNCDLLLTGTATSYLETQNDGDPKRRVLGNGDAQWGFYTNRRVDLDVSAKLLDPRTGSLLWTQKGSGYSYDNLWNPLPIPAALQVPPIVGLQEMIGLAKRGLDSAFKGKKTTGVTGNELLYLYDTSFKEMRQKALFYAVDYVAGDFRGSRDWMPGVKPSN